MIADFEILLRTHSNGYIKGNKFFFFYKSRGGKLKLRLTRSVFLKNFLFFFLLIFLFLWRDLPREYLVVSKIEEKKKIKMFAVKKVCDILLTLLQVITILAT